MRGDDVLADQNGQREIAEQALFLRHIGFEAMTIAEEQFGALALDDQGIERREDMHQAGIALVRQLQRVRPRPMLQLTAAFECDRYQFSAADARLDQPPHRSLARRIEMAD